MMCLSVEDTFSFNQYSPKQKTILLDSEPSDPTTLVTKKGQNTGMGFMEIEWERYMIQGQFYTCTMVEKKKESKFHG